MEFVQQVFEEAGPVAVVAAVGALIAWVLFLVVCLLIVWMTGSTDGLKDFAVAVKAFRSPRRPRSKAAKAGP